MYCINAYVNIWSSQEGGVVTMKGNRITKSIEGQMYEERGFRRVSSSHSTYYKIVGGPELCVVKLGQPGYKTCEFDAYEIPEDDIERDTWASQWAMTIASDRNFEWRQD